MVARRAERQIRLGRSALGSHFVTGPASSGQLLMAASGQIPKLCREFYDHDE
jgi:hypothetical protein